MTIESIKRLNNLFSFKKMTKKQKLFLEELRTKFKNKEITIDESHKLWKEHPDYIKQYGREVAQ